MTKACTFIVTGALALFAAGCATVTADKHVAASADLVEQRTGRRPAWESPWDERSPAWDEQSVLSVEDAVELALRNNRELRVEIENIGMMHADLVQAGLLQNPRLNFMVMFPEGGGRSMLRSAGFPLQALEDLWLIPAREGVAEARLQQAILGVADQAVELAAEVKRKYARLQYAQRAIELLRTNLEIVEQSRRLVQSQQTGGKATLVEVNVVRIRYLRLQSDLFAMESEYRSLKRELLESIGFAEAADAWRVAPIDEMSEALAEPASEDALIAAALEQRLDLQSARWSLTAAEQGIELARREAWPQVAVGLSFERAPAPRSQNPSVAGQIGNAAAQSLAGNEVESASITPFTPKMRDVDWTVGPMFDLEVPIFDWNQAGSARAFHEFRQRAAEYDARRQSVVAKLREASVGYENAYRQAQFFREEILPEVERNLDGVRESYRAGQDNVTIFLQTQEDLITTRLNTLAFVRDAIERRAELERQVGGRIPQVGAQHEEGSHD